MSASLQATTITRLKTTAFTGLDPNDENEDEWLQGAIDEVSSAFEAYLGCKMKQEALVETYDVQQFQTQFWLRRFPIASVTAVETRTAVSVAWADATTLDSGTYDYEPNRGRLIIDTVLPPGPMALRVSYTGGFATDTDDLLANYREIASAAERQVAYMYRRKLDPGKASVTIAGQDQVFQEPVMLLAGVKEALSPWRRLTVV